MNIYKKTWSLKWKRFDCKKIFRRRSIIVGNSSFLCLWREKKRSGTKRKCSSHVYRSTIFCACCLSLGKKLRKIKCIVTVTPSHTHEKKHKSFHCCDMGPKTDKRKSKRTAKKTHSIDHKFNDYDHFYHNKYWYNRNRYSCMISRKQWENSKGNKVLFQLQKLIIFAHHLFQQAIENGQHERKGPKRERTNQILHFTTVLIINIFPYPI